MKKWIVIAIVLLIGFLIYLKITGFYNKAIIQKEDAKGQWSKVESAYQRRSDLIPNLVNTVKGYADFEQETLIGVTNARASATQTKIDPTNITPEQLAKFQEAQAGLSSALSRLLVSVEKYPDLKANENFLALQSQLEGTENRIKVERDRFNDSVIIYNKFLQTFPNNILAGFFHLAEMGYFQAVAGSENAPVVKF